MQGEAPSEEQAPSTPVADDALGGRLYDRFYDRKTFIPDDPSTPGVADGQGGPLANGTLTNRDGQPVLNDPGHDYRLKNFFGWDLRGRAGISGPEYQNRPTALDIDLLDEELSKRDLETLLREGSDVLPAYDSVLSKDEIGAVVAFIFGVREGRLPRPDKIWTPSRETPGNYRLVPGADPDRGKEIFAQRCAGCHGGQGTKLLLDDGDYSLGSHARQKAYEDWFKILNGQPFTTMKRFVRGASGEEIGQEVLDLLAALCDRTAFPLGDASKPDVPDGDPRCGEYLR